MSEPSMERRTLLAFVLSMLVLAVWGYFFRPKPGVQPSPQPQPAAAVPAPAPPPAQSRALAVPGEKAAGGATVITASEERTLQIDHDLYHIEISNRGAVVHAWQLTKYKDDRRPPGTLDLVNATTAEQIGGWPFSIVLEDPKLEAEANSALYHVTPQGSALKAPVEVKFEWSDGHLSVEKAFSFSDSYQVKAVVSASLDGKPLPVGLAWRGGFGDVTARTAAQLVTVFYHSGGKLETLAVKKLGAPDHPEQRQLVQGPLEYAGIEDQFFAAAFLPESSGLSLWHWKRDRTVTVDGKPTTEPVAEMAAGGVSAEPFAVRLYVGPKAMDLLAKQTPNLDQLTGYGWTGYIAKPLFEILKWIHRWVPNWGWAIIVLTLLINTALFPLKMKSWRSMQRMQKLAPEIRTIQDRYKKYSMRDPRRAEMNKEVMAVYQREGINPAGGCLPMLLQMPIWWGLYRMLQGAIELRHTPWLGWIKDLSAPDPYYIMPILMTVAMYLTQKTTPQTTMDPTQQKMMSLMTFAFGFIFLNVSSGLVLYIFTSSLVGLAQQWFLNRTEPLAPAANRGKKK